ncbi:thioredoxin family protein [Chenggangzhangella methanolivorans]|uniref:Thioredoxin family protein n=1 Tax=Chenggangzhangella methanolivorans TaxID=1437009 RepID=A0A9E6ULM7_9HYPH|nr:thioredoxin family protein [Chenggangzhangella methanolivorans]QZO00722.1 thioredoxin family protein [Chenggangzhangella methanolivorans]
MITRRLAIACLVAIATVAPAVAQEGPKPFDKAAFDAALAAGGPFVVHVTAPWCPICRAQKPILARLRAEPRFKDFGQFEVDFDSDKASLRVVNARLQSTLIVYRGGKEIARTVGDREEGWIEELMEKAL